MKITDTLEQIIEKVEPYYTEGQKEIDITAVEKYIHKNRKELNIQVPGIYFKNGRRCLKYFVLGKGFLEYCFPNKPLSLYTEEELKHLLEILNNI